MSDDFVLYEMIGLRLCKVDVVPLGGDPEMTTCSSVRDVVHGRGSSVDRSWLAFSQAADRRRRKLLQ